MIYSVTRHKIFQFGMLTSMTALMTSSSQSIVPHPNTVKLMFRSLNFISWSSVSWMDRKMLETCCGVRRVRSGHKLQLDHRMCQPQNVAREDTDPD